MARWNLAATVLALLAAQTGAFARSSEEAAPARACADKRPARPGRFSLSWAVAPAERPLALTELVPVGAAGAWSREAKSPASRSLLLRQTLLREIGELLSLLDVTPQAAPDRPKALCRLGDTWAALARSFDADVPGGRSVRHQRAASHARAAAIARYRELLARHPSYCRFPLRTSGERGCRDQLLLSLGQELERAGKPAQAADAYRELVGGFPRSAHAPRAWLALGERAFAQAKRGAGSWREAGDDYARAFEGLPNGVFRAYARYKLAHAEWNRGDRASALGDVEAAVRLARGANDPRAAALSDRARQDWLAFYAQAGDLDRALPAIARIGAGKDLAMLARLGDRLLDIGRFDAALAVIAELRKRGAGDPCAERAAAARALLASRPGDTRAALRALDSLFATYRAQQQSSASDAAVVACARQTATALIDAAMGWQVEAAGSNAMAGNGDPQAVEAAMRLYRRALSGFSRGQLGAFLGTARRSGEALVMRGYGDLLYATGRWRECARALAAAEQADPSGPDAADALMLAGVCWQRALDAAGGSFDSATRAEATRALDRYACRAEPARGDAEAAAADAAIAEARARLRASPPEPRSNAAARIFATSGGSSAEGP